MKTLKIEKIKTRFNNTGWAYALVVWNAELRTKSLVHIFDDMKNAKKAKAAIEELIA